MLENPVNLTLCVGQLKSTEGAGYATEVMGFVSPWLILKITADHQAIGQLIATSSTMGYHSRDSVFIIQLIVEGVGDCIVCWCRLGDLFQLLSFPAGERFAKRAVESCATMVQFGPRRYVGARVGLIIQDVDKITGFQITVLWVDCD